MCRTGVICAVDIISTWVVRAADELSVQRVHGQRELWETDGFLVDVSFGRAGYYYWIGLHAATDWNSLYYLPDFTCLSLYVGLLTKQNTLKWRIMSIKVVLLEISCFDHVYVLYLLILWTA